MAEILVNNFRGNKITETLIFVLEECCNCGMPLFMPQYLQKRLMNNPGTSFYCPNGHGQHYSGKTESQKRIEALEQQVKEEQAAYNIAINCMLDEKNKAKKLKQQLNRVHKGVCPCCNRTFVNPQKHMETKHPNK